MTTNLDNLVLSGNNTVAGNETIAGTLAVTGAITATGGVAGNVTGNASTATLATSASPVVPQVLSGDGAITVPTDRLALVRVTKGSAAAITLATPLAGDEGKEIVVFSETAYAHQITCPDGFNAKGSSGTATASAAANNYIRLVAFNLHWRVIANVNFTLA